MEYDFAIIYFGLTRSVKKTHESHKKHVFDILKKENLSSEQQAAATNFAQLLEKVALISPQLRVRFSTSHPKDMTDDVLHMVAKHTNICNYIHLPVQSGSSRILEMMNISVEHHVNGTKISLCGVVIDCDACRRYFTCQ